MIVKLVNIQGEQLHQYEEEPGHIADEIFNGASVLLWNGRHFTFDDIVYGEAEGEYVIYKEATLRAVPTCIIVR